MQLKRSALENLQKHLDETFLTIFKHCVFCTTSLRYLDTSVEKKMSNKENVILLEVVDWTSYPKNEGYIPPMNTELKVFTIVLLFLVLLFAICLIILASFSE